MGGGGGQVGVFNFPSFSEGLSLRDICSRVLIEKDTDFPSFSEGLSLRALPSSRPGGPPGFPFLFGGTFIEGHRMAMARLLQTISLPFRRDFH